MSLIKRCIAEFIGTLWLVLGGCGSAVLAASYTESSLKVSEASASVGIGILGVAIAFGVSVMTMAYAIGHISGCHLNPAVSFGLWAGKRFSGADLLPYIVSQVLGAIAGSAIVYNVAMSKPKFALSGSNPLATNGFGLHSPAGYSLVGCFAIEVILTFFFLLIILGATDRRAPQGFAPVAIGLSLTLIHLISIPITNTSVNPARSTGPAIFAGAESFSQLWLFWVAPILGALLAGWLYHAMFREVSQTAETSREPMSVL